MPRKLDGSMKLMQWNKAVKIEEAAFALYGICLFGFVCCSWYMCVIVV